MTARDFRPVAKLEDVPVGAIVNVRFGDEEICLANSNGEIFAVGATCTHSEFPISEGYLTAPCTVECAWHGAKFDLRTGQVLRQPAEDPLPVYAVRVRDGVIEVGGRLGAAEGEAA